MLKHAWKWALVLAATATALVIMVLWVGVAPTLAALQEVGWAAFLSVGALLAATFILQAAAWTILNRVVNLRLGVLTALEGTIVALAGNIITPTAHLGGEPLKVLYAGRRRGLSYEALASTVLLGKYIETISFVLFICLGTVVCALGLKDVLFRPPHLAWGIVLVSLGGLSLLAMIVLTVSLLRRRTPLAAIAGLLCRLRIFPTFFDNLRKRAAKVELRVSQVFRREGRSIVPAFFVYLLTHAAIAIKPLAFFYLGWKVRLGLPELALFFLTSQALLAFQLVPSGVGTLDGGLFAMIYLAGMNIHRPQMAVFLLCIRFWDAAVVAVGAVLAARVGTGLLSGRAAARSQVQQEADSVQT
jgi:uncharacterized protein (TIRG00374 family)